jgi:hypothetical protein
MVAYEGRTAETQWAVPMGTDTFKSENDSPAALLCDRRIGATLAVAEPRIHDGGKNSLVGCQYALHPSSVRPRDRGVLLVLRAVSERWARRIAVPFNDGRGGCLTFPMGRDL